MLFPNEWSKLMTKQNQFKTWITNAIAAITQTVLWCMVLPVFLEATDDRVKYTGIVVLIMMTIFATTTIAFAQKSHQPAAAPTSDQQREQSTSS
jgi:hypothetical protein